MTERWKRAFVVALAIMTGVNAHYGRWGWTVFMGLLTLLSNSDIER